MCTLIQITVTLHNHLIEEYKSLCDVPNEEADWFTDGMTAIDVVNVAETWEDYANEFLEFCKPETLLRNSLHFSLN